MAPEDNPADDESATKEEWEAWERERRADKETVEQGEPVGVER